MVANLERIKYELEQAGFDLEKDEFEYQNECAKSAYEICNIFANQGHSLFSAMVTKKLIQKLLIEDSILTPLTNNPEEWVEISNEPLYQSKRDFSCFSNDLESYWNINEKLVDGNKVLHKLERKV